MAIGEIFSVTFYIVVSSYVVLFSVKEEDNSQGKAIVMHANLIVSLSLYLLFIDFNKYIPFYIPIELIGQDLILFLVINFILFLYLAYVSVVKYRYIYLVVFAAAYILSFFLRVSLDVSYYFVIAIVVVIPIIVLFVFQIKNKISKK